MNTLIKYIAVISLFLLIISCEKEDISSHIIVGTWVSTDNVDTLKFMDNKSFTKSYHTFLYSLNIRKITIQYSGPNEILVSPSIHNYTLTNRKLKIDFTNGCYGFRSDVITFIRLN